MAHVSIPHHNGLAAIKSFLGKTTVTSIISHLTTTRALLSILLLCLPILLHLFSSPKPHKNGHSLPQPTDTLPLLGNAIRFLQPRHTLFNWFLRQQTHFFRCTYAISVPTLPPGVVISTPIYLEYILRHPHLITKGPFFRARSFDLFGHGIINASGALWRAQRKAGQTFFNGDTLSTLTTTLLPELYSTILEPALSTASTSTTNDAILDLQPLFHALTTSLMGHLAYSLPHLTTTHPFSQAFTSASATTATRFQNPLYPLTELVFGASFRANLATVKRFGLSIVAAARRRRANAAFASLLDGNDPPVFDGTLIDALIEGLGASGLDDGVVADSAVNFLSAGRDTTSEGLTWAVYALVRDKRGGGRVWRKLREEVERCFGGEKGGVGEGVEVSELQPGKVPYVMAVWSEALRLYPPVPLEILQVEAEEGVRLPDGTVLPHRAVVVWCVWAMNRAREVWGDDAAEFRPERWLDEEGQYVPRSPWEYPVYNGGPRSCLGKKMAELLGCWVLCRLVQEWEFEEAGGDGGKERVSAMSLTLPMEGGLPCRVRRRRRMEGERIDENQNSQ